MFALDTNILLRYIMQDHKAQAKRAAQAIESLTTDKPAFISCIVLCELGWALSSSYKIPKHELVETLEGVLSIDVFDIENFNACLAALKLYKKGQADFSDYLIQQIAKHEGYDTVLTFDKKALKHPGFQSPE